MTPAQYLPALAEVATIGVVHGGVPVEGSNVINATGDGRGKTYLQVADDIRGALLELGWTRVDLLSDDMMLADQIREHRVNLVWCNSGGVQGINGMGHAAAVCETAGVPYIGHSPFGVARLDDKSTFKAICAQSGIPTARWLTLVGHRPVTLSELRAHFEAGDSDGPYIVKPVSGRASLNVEVAETLGDLLDVIAGVREATNHGDVLVEEYLPGAEYAVATAGGPWAMRGRAVSRRPDGGVEIIAPIQRVLGEGERIFASLDHRPITADRVRSTEGVTRAQLSGLARRVQEALGLETAVRLDARADAHGIIKILECNPKPDLARPNGEKISLICAELARTGADYPDLIGTILVNRLEQLRHRRPALFAPLARLLPEGDFA